MHAARAGQGVLMQISGSCHCGNIAFAFTLDPPSAGIPARACSCRFCTKHGCVWTASATGMLRVVVKDARNVNRYTFGTRTAQFHVCRGCGIVPVATSTIQGRDYAVVNTNTFESVPENLLSRATVSFDGEGEGERLARRAKHWIPNVEHIESN